MSEQCKGHGTISISVVVVVVVEKGTRSFASSQRMW